MASYVNDDSAVNSECMELIFISFSIEVDSMSIDLGFHRWDC